MILSSSNGLTDEPSRIWNCDESGFPLCPKSGKVLARSGAKTVYASGSAQKQQITTLVAISASGNVIPPMHIFPGVPTKGYSEVRARKAQNNLVHSNTNRNQINKLTL